MKMTHTHKKIFSYLKYFIIGAFIGVMGVVVFCAVQNHCQHASPVDRVQKRTLFTLGLLWDDEKYLHVCKTAHYKLVVKIGSTADAYYGTSVPLVSINDAPFVEAKVYGDLLLDREEFVFYKDYHSLQSPPNFNVRFDWYTDDKKKTQCYVQLNDLNHPEKKLVSEYGKIQLLPISKHKDQ